jgi:Xaa-Pro dipeptidase
MSLTRLKRLNTILQEAGLDAVAINPGPTLVYLTGLEFHLMERPVVAVFPHNGEPVMVLPELEAPRVKALPYAVQTFTFGDNPAQWKSAFKSAFQHLNLNGKQIGVESTRLRILELSFLEGAAPHARYTQADSSLALLRLQKDEAETAAMRKAVEIAQNALRATLPVVKPGITEKQIAAELTLQLLRAGSDSEFPFAPTVTAGPNSANPHATPSNHPLAAGDLLVIDWGARYNGYCSDITRTFAIGAIDPELARIAELAGQANAAGRAASRPGIPAGDIDRAARAVIDQAGYGAYFTHRVGHGLGMEAHEEPYMFAENQTLLAPGMTYTIEPGIYLPGRGGARVEDDMVITAGGAESLSDLPRELIVIQ